MYEDIYTCTYTYIHTCTFMNEENTGNKKVPAIRGVLRTGQQTN